jgi:teichuronic acid biosynthesis glycosyltransferase TuaC
MNVLFISSANKSGKQSNLILAQSDSIADEGIHVINYPLIGKGITGYLKNIKKIKKEVREKNIDILHAHFGFCALISIFGKSGKKLVVSLMGTDVIGTEHKKLSYRLVDKCIVLAIRFFANHLFDSTIVKSNQMLNYLNKNKTFHVIPNGVDFDIFYTVDKNQAREQLGLDPSKKIILFSTDPQRPEKNFALAEKAVSYFNDSSIELLIINEISQKELNLYYNASDVILLTSLHEGSPNIIKESLACNKVIVSTNVGDVAQNIKDVNNCFLTSFDPQETFEKLKEALNTNGLSDGREKIQHLNKKVVAKKIVSLYNSL